ncbi:MAG: phage tail tape measure protein, partial [Pseudobutyrivibrio sp.]|nr:phage tail tape measure protein [Pseudobutyrivibrio sp.]
FNVAKAALAGIAETYTSFEQAMADTAAIAGASVSEVERMTTAAREAGRTTTITAEDSAKALGYMALAGWSVDESIEGLMPVLRLAEATGADLQTTSDLVTDSLGAVGLQVKDLTQYMDMLVATNNNANTTAEMLMESLIKTGGAAVTLGANMDFNSNFGLDELMTAIGVLGSNGVKAEEAGTALNSILTRLGAHPEARKEMEALGVSIYDTQGNFIGLEETLYAIGEAMEGLTEEDKMTALRLIAGTRYASKLSYLMASLQDGASIAESSWGKLNSEIENSVGDLDVMNARATDTLAAASKRWISAVDDLKIGMGTTFGDDAKDLLNEFSAKMPAIIEMVDEFGEKHSYQIKDLIDSLGDFAEDGAEGLLNLIETVADNSGTILDLIKGLTVGQLALTGIANGAKMFATFMALPTPLKVLAATVAAITAIYTGITIIKGNYEKAQQEIIDSNLDKHFGKIALSIDEIEQASEKLVYNGLKGLYEAFEDQNDEIESLNKNIKNTIKDLDKSDWKIEMGIEMTKDDAESYKSSVQSLIKDVQSYIEETRYKSSLADKILFGDGGLVGLDNYYDSIQEEAAIAGDNLAKKLDEAFADGVLTNVEAKDIAKARQRLIEIQEKIADTDFTSALEANTTDALLGGLTKDSFEELQKENAEQLQEKQQTRRDAYTFKLSEIESSDNSEQWKDKAKQIATREY